MGSEFDGMEWETQAERSTNIFGNGNCNVFARTEEQLHKNIMKDIQMITRVSEEQRQ